MHWEHWCMDYFFMDLPGKRIMAATHVYPKMGFF
jgi:hypothetical protein